MLAVLLTININLIIKTSFKILTILIILGYLNKLRKYISKKRYYKRIEKGSNSSKSSHEKEKIGNQFEEYVHKKFNNYGIIPFLNVLLPNQSGETTEVDMILTNEKGIFCVECKYNEPGSRFTGGIDVSKWNLYTPNDKQRYERENPFLQNERHIKALNKLLLDNNFIDAPIYNVVITNTDYQISSPSNIYTEKSGYFNEGNKIMIKTDSFNNSGFKQFIELVENLKTTVDYEKINILLNDYEGTVGERMMHKIRVSHY